MIKPGPGRIVWFYPSIEAGRDPNGQALGAMVAKVIDDRCVNLTVSHSDGSTYPAQHVQLLQDDDPEPETAYCCWMPYQKGQAAKHDTPQPAPALSPEQLASIHHAIDIVAETTQARFEVTDARLNRIGELTLQKLIEFDRRLAADMKAVAPPPNEGSFNGQSAGL